MAMGLAATARNAARFWLIVFSAGDCRGAFTTKAGRIWMESVSSEGEDAMADKKVRLRLTREKKIFVFMRRVGLIPIHALTGPSCSEVRKLREYSS